MRKQILTRSWSIAVYLCLPLSLSAIDIAHGTAHQWNGENYNKHKSIQFQGALDQMSKYVFQGNEDILDIGSGDGEITSLVAEKTKGILVGMDVDPSMVSFANSKYRIDRLKFVQGNASEIHFKNEFDLILSFNTAHWIKDQVEFLKRVHEALRPAGKILFGFPTFLPNEPIGTSLMISLFKQAMSSNKWKRYFRDFTYPWNFYSEKQYQDFLRLAHFKHSKVAITKKPFKLPSPAAFIAWMKQISPHLKYLPERERENFLKEIAQSYLDKVPLNEKGEVLLSHAQLEVVATRD